MLEYNFNSLDDDFITLWSQYILYNDTSIIIKPLQELAEKGQINAIQSWYLLKKQEEQNPTIDAIVDGYYGDSFNEALAIANRLYDQNKQQIHGMQQQIVSYSERAENELIEAMDQYCKTEYAKQFIKTLELAEHTAKNLNSATAWQRLYELYRADPIICLNIYNPFNIDEKGVKIIRKSLRNGLKQRYVDAARIKYALGKNLLLFGTKEVEKQEGRDILLELSKRPLKYVSIEAPQAEDERI